MNHWPPYCLLILLLSHSLNTLAAEPLSQMLYWSDNWRGWHFYENPAQETEEEKAIQAPSPQPKPPTPLTRAPELIQFEQLQKTLEDTRNIAIINPTETNVRRYMELEAKVVSQASYFADVAQRLAWSTPRLDPTLQGRPVNAKALQVFEANQQDDRKQLITRLAKDHVLFFFYRSDCPYCHAFAPTLETFQNRYGISIVAVSLDGGAMPGFPQARADNGIARTLQVTQVPALYLAQPFSGHITAIGFGVLSESQLLERLAVVTTPAVNPPNLGAMTASTGVSP